MKKLLAIIIILLFLPPAALAAPTDDVESAVPDSARVSEMAGLEADPDNHLLMNAMAPNVAGVIGSAVAAGILLGFLG